MVVAPDEELLAGQPDPLDQLAGDEHAVERDHDVADHARRRRGARRRPSGARRGCRRAAGSGRPAGSGSASSTTTGPQKSRSCVPEQQRRGSRARAGRRRPSARPGRRRARRPSRRPSWNPPAPPRLRSSGCATSGVPRRRPPRPATPPCRRSTRCRPPGSRRAPATSRSRATRLCSSASRLKVTTTAAMRCSGPSITQATLGRAPVDDGGRRHRRSTGGSLALQRSTRPPSPAAQPARCTRLARRSQAAGAYRTHRGRSIASFASADRPTSASVNVTGSSTDGVDAGLGRTTTRALTSSASSAGCAELGGCAAGAGGRGFVASVMVATRLDHGGGVREFSAGAHRRVGDRAASPGRPRRSGVAWPVPAAMLGRVSSGGVTIELADR